MTTKEAAAGRREARLLRDGFYDPECGCDHGWRQVDPRYALTHVPQDLETMAADLQARVDAAKDLGVADHGLDADLREYAELRRLRLTWAEAVFPCPRCRKVQFRRWRAGCYRANHHRSTCKICGPNAEEHLDDDEGGGGGEEF